MVEWFRPFRIILRNPNDRQFGCCWDCARGLSMASEYHENSHRSHEPTMHSHTRHPSLYLDQPITKGWCQAIGCYTSYPTDSPYATWAPSFPCMGIPMWKIRRSWDRLIFNMGIPILVRRHLYIETSRRIGLCSRLRVVVFPLNPGHGVKSLESSDVIIVATDCWFYFDNHFQ